MRQQRFFGRTPVSMKNRTFEVCFRPTGMILLRIALARPVWIRRTADFESGEVDAASPGPLHSGLHRRLRHGPCRATARMRPACRIVARLATLRCSDARLGTLLRRRQHDRPFPCARQSIELEGSWNARLVIRSSTVSSATRAERRFFVVHIAWPAARPIARTPRFCANCGMALPGDGARRASIARTLGRPSAGTSEAAPVCGAVLRHGRFDCVVRRSRSPRIFAR